MGQPVKLSDELVLDARIAGAAMGRSIAGQVEFWARVGKRVEERTDGRRLRRLQDKAALPLSEIVATINGPAGRARLETYLESRPYPRFASHTERAGTFVREDEDGTKTVGRFNEGAFEAEA